MKRKLRVPVARIDCSQSIARVFDFIDGHLSPEAEAEVNLHLETCRHCFDRYEFEKLLKLRFRHMKTNPLSGKLRTRIAQLIEAY